MPYQKRKDILALLKEKAFSNGITEDEVFRQVPVQEIGMTEAGFKKFKEFVKNELKIDIEVSFNEVKEKLFAATDIADLVYEKLPREDDIFQRMGSY